MYTRCVNMYMDIHNRLCMCLYMWMQRMCISIYRCLCICHITHILMYIGVFQGRNGVMWSKDANNMTASAIPLPLQSQVLTLLHATVLKALYIRILQPVDTPFRCGLGQLALPADVEGIGQGLNTTGMLLCICIEVCILHYIY